MNTNSSVKTALGIPFCLLMATFAHADAELSISPVEQSIAPGSVFSIDVDISGVADLYGYQFDVLFNPALIEALSSTEGSFLNKGGSTFYIPGTNDNTGGSVGATADTLVTAVPGVTGTGNLAVLNFEALASGVSSVTIANAELIDSQFNFISSSSKSGSVTVVAPVSAPEIDPASAAGALTTLFGSLMVLRRWKVAKPR